MTIARQLRRLCRSMFCETPTAYSSRGYPLFLEPLGHRVLPAVSATYSDTTLTVLGDGSANDILVSAPGGI
ncbi:MAG TPA: hypothetical protein VKE74_02695 [Gemmataceae bacterium]|nr:hypothetical protein [Gemmataceae bacterium]